MRLGINTDNHHCLPCSCLPSLFPSLPYLPLFLFLPFFPHSPHHHHHLISQLIATHKKKLRKKTPQLHPLLPLQSFITVILSYHLCLHLHPYQTPPSMNIHRRWCFAVLLGVCCRYSPAQLQPLQLFTSSSGAPSSQAPPEISLPPVHSLPLGKWELLDPC